MTSAVISARTSLENKNRLDLLAKATKRNVGFYINELIENYLDDLEDIYLSEQILAEIRSGKMETYSSEDFWDKVGV